MKLKLNHFNSLITLVNHFKSDKSCRDFITEQHWGDKIVCPLCGGEHNVLDEHLQSYINEAAILEI